MSKRLPVIFIGYDDAEVFRCSVESFLDTNAYILHRLYSLALVYQPTRAMSAILRALSPRINKCVIQQKQFHWSSVFATMQTLKSRHVIIIPYSWNACAPLHTYFDQISDVLTNQPDVCMIQLASDTHSSTHAAVFHYATPNILIGNGDIRFDIPILLPTTCPKSEKSLIGRLKPGIFNKPLERIKLV